SSHHGNKLTNARQIPVEKRDEFLGQMLYAARLDYTLDETADLKDITSMYAAFDVSMPLYWSLDNGGRKIHRHDAIYHDDIPHSFAHHCDEELYRKHVREWALKVSRHTGGYAPDLQEALVLAEEAFELYPVDSEIIEMLVTIHYRLEEYDKIIMLLGPIVEQDQGHLRWFVWLALAEERLGNYYGAILYREVIAQNKPADRENARRLAALYYRTGKTKAPCAEPIFLKPSHLDNGGQCIEGVDSQSYEAQALRVFGNAHMVAGSMRQQPRLVGHHLAQFHTLIEQLNDENKIKIAKSCLEHLLKEPYGDSETELEREANYRFFIEEMLSRELKSGNVGPQHVLSAAVGFEYKDLLEATEKSVNVLLNIDEAIYRGTLSGSVRSFFNDEVTSSVTQEFLQVVEGKDSEKDDYDERKAQRMSYALEIVIHRLMQKLKEVKPNNGEISRIFQWMGIYYSRAYVAPRVIRSQADFRSFLEASIDPRCQPICRGAYDRMSVRAAFNYYTKTTARIIYGIDGFDPVKIKGLLAGVLGARHPHLNAIYRSVCRAMYPTEETAVLAVDNYWPTVPGEDNFVLVVDLLGEALLEKQHDEAFIKSAAADVAQILLFADDFQISNPAAVKINYLMTKNNLLGVLIKAVDRRGIITSADEPLTLAQVNDLRARILYSRASGEYETLSEFVVAQAVMRFPVLGRELVEQAKQDIGTLEFAKLFVDDLTRIDYEGIFARMAYQHPDIYCLFGDCRNITQVARAASIMRNYFPYRITSPDIFTSPLDFAVQNGIYLELVPGVFLSPISGSFKRHTIFKMDKHNQVTSLFEMKIPGRDEGNTATLLPNALEAYDELKTVFGEDISMVNIVSVFIVEVDNVKDALYGYSEWIKDQVRVVVLFELPESAPRLDQVTPFDLRRIAEKYSEEYAGDAQLVLDDLAADMLRFMAMVHSGKISGMKQEESSDFHLGNFRLKLPLGSSIRKRVSATSVADLDSVSREYLRRGSDFSKEENAGLEFIIGTAADRVFHLGAFYSPHDAAQLFRYRGIYDDEKRQLESRYSLESLRAKDAELLVAEAVLSLFTAARRMQENMSLSRSGSSDSLDNGGNDKLCPRQPCAVIMFKGGTFGALKDEARAEVIEALRQDFQVQVLPKKQLAAIDVVQLWRDMVEDILTHLPRVKFKEERKAELDEIISRNSQEDLIRWKERWIRYLNERSAQTKQDRIYGIPAIRVLEFFIWYHEQPVQLVLLRRKTNRSRSEIIQKYAQRLGGRYSEDIAQVLLRRGFWPDIDSLEEQTFVKAYVVLALRILLIIPRVSKLHFLKEAIVRLGISRKILKDKEEFRKFIRFISFLGLGIHGAWSDAEFIREDLKYLSQEEVTAFIRWGQQAVEVPSSVDNGGTNLPSQSFILTSSGIRELNQQFPVSTKSVQSFETLAEALSTLERWIVSSGKIHGPPIQEDYIHDNTGNLIDRRSVIAYRDKNGNEVYNLHDFQFYEILAATNYNPFFVYNCTRIFLAYPTLKQASYALAQFMGYVPVEHVNYDPKASLSIGDAVAYLNEVFTRYPAGVITDRELSRADEHLRDTSPAIAALYELAAYAQACDSDDLDRRVINWRRRNIFKVFLSPYWGMLSVYLQYLEMRLKEDCKQIGSYYLGVYVQVRNGKIEFRFNSIKDIPYFPPFEKIIGQNAPEVQVINGENSEILKGYRIRVVRLPDFCIQIGVWNYTYDCTNVIVDIVDEYGTQINRNRDIFLVVFPHYKLVYIGRFFPNFPDKQSSKYREGRGRALLHEIIKQYAGYDVVAWIATEEFQKSLEKMPGYNPITKITNPKVLKAVIAQRLALHEDNLFWNDAWETTHFWGVVPSSAGLSSIDNGGGKERALSRIEPQTQDFVQTSFFDRRLASLGEVWPSFNERQRTFLATSYFGASDHLLELFLGLINGFVIGQDMVYKPSGLRGWNDFIRGEIDLYVSQIGVIRSILNHGRLRNEHDIKIRRWRSGNGLGFWVIYSPSLVKEYVIQIKTALKADADLRDAWVNTHGVNPDNANPEEWMSRCKGSSSLSFFLRGAYVWDYLAGVSNYRNAGARIDNVSAYDLGVSPREAYLPENAIQYTRVHNQLFQAWYAMNEFEALHNGLPCIPGTSQTEAYRRIKEFIDAVLDCEIIIGHMQRFLFQLKHRCFVFFDGSPWMIDPKQGNARIRDYKRQLHRSLDRLNGYVSLKGLHHDAREKKSLKGRSFLFHWRRNSDAVTLLRQRYRSFLKTLPAKTFAKALLEIGLADIIHGKVFQSLVTLNELAQYKHMVGNPAAARAYQRQSKRYEDWLSNIKEKRLLWEKKLLSTAELFSFSNDHAPQDLNGQLTYDIIHGGVWYIEPTLSDRPLHYFRAAFLESFERGSFRQAADLHEYVSFFARTANL
ncbi:MAG: hypothetical protein PHV55_05215, partial [Candidatus Omnitrophica bacterium]|nr:hypothetical protein [Candidatus Omnitrophota bacterium]